MIASSLLTSLRPTMCLGLFTTRQFAMLLLLHTADRKLSFLNLCANLDMSKPAVSRSLDRLSILHFIERHRSHDDRRKTFVSLTDKGRELVDRVEAAA
jgi:DNA-binding MarR family transcriptional regulator